MHMNEVAAIFCVIAGLFCAAVAADNLHRRAGYLQLILALTLGLFGEWLWLGPFPTSWGL